MAVIWNPTLRKSVGIVIPNPKMGYVVGFGVCPDTSDPKLVKISFDRKSSIWEVDVFTLSTHVWKNVHTGRPPFKSRQSLAWFQVFVNGFIYFRAHDSTDLDHGFFVISFDLKSEKFGEVCLPERLVHAPHAPDLELAKVNESLGLLEYYAEGEMEVCDVWTRKDGANKSFTKIYTVKVEGKSMFYSILGFRNNGEVVREVLDDDNYRESGIEVYEPSSGHIYGVGISGHRYRFSVRSYMETLLLLDQSDSIIHSQR